jgi:hypothetical protein
VCASRLVSLRACFFVSNCQLRPSYFATKDCTYTDSSGRPVPAPLASKPDKPTRIGQSRRRPQKDSYLESSVSAPASDTARRETLTSSRTPSDSRDDYAERLKRPRVGSISFPAPESQAPVPLAPRSTFAATRFEIVVVRELVNRTYTITPGPLLRLSVDPFCISFLCSLSSPSPPFPPAHIHGRRLPGTHTPLSLIRAMFSRLPFLQSPRCKNGFSPHLRRSILKGC